MMKKCVTLVVLIISLGGNAFAAGGVGIYGFSWDGNEAGSGKGGGLLVKSDFAAFGGANLRLGYAEFDDVRTDVTPLEFGLRVQLPFFIQPYAGIGGGYYLYDADIGAVSDSWGWYTEAGVELHFLILGLFVEARYMNLKPDVGSTFSRVNDIDEDYMDMSGWQGNVGLLLRW